MTYKFKNKTLTIPDKEIENSMKILEITKEEAIQMWLEDNDYLTNETVEELTEKAKENRRYEKSNTPRKKTTRERKVDEEKKKFLLSMKILIEGLGGTVTNVKNEAEFSYIFGENSYTVKLVKHRPPKK